MTNIREKMGNFQTHGPLEYLRVFLSRMLMDPTTDFETKIASFLIIQEIVTNMTEQYENSIGDSFEEKLIPILQSRFEDFEFKRFVKIAVYKYSYSEDCNDQVWSDLWKQIVESIVE